MMRSLVLIAGLSCASAAATSECALNGARAVDDLLDSATYIWASVQRCQKPGVGNKKGNAVLCSLDISSAIEATNAMVNVILKSVDKCGGLNTENKECGLEAGKLTKHVSGLAAAAGIVAQKCPATALSQHTALGALASPVMCTIDLKNTLKQLFKAVKHLRRSEDDCKGRDEDSRDCAANALDVVSSFAGMGGYLAGAVGQCTRTTVLNNAAATADTRVALCAQAANDLLHHTMEVAQSGVQLSQKCEKEAPAPAPPVPVVVESQVPRLFELGDKAAASSSTNLILGACLPILAVMGFVSGRYYASQRGVEQARELMSGF